MKHLAMIAAFSAMLVAPAAMAQPVPAELPPAGYAGRDYVDSQGCTFQRLVFNGMVSWVALLGADGAQICTSVAVAPGQPEPAPAAEEAPKPAVSPPLPAGYWVQVGAFGDTANAERAVAQVKALGYEGLQWPVKGGQLTAALAGPFADGEAANAALGKLLARFPQAFRRP